MRDASSKWRLTLVVAALGLLSACNSPLQSQRFFLDAAQDDPLLEPIHTTPLYTVYYDHGLKRCVLHSSYTWGESGGGTGGTGIGVSIFNCDPARLKKHVDQLRADIATGTADLRLPDSVKASPPVREIPPAQGKEATP